MKLGDTIYPGLLRTTQGAPVAENMRQAVIDQVPAALRERPDDLDEVF